MKDEIKESINNIQSIVDFYKLNDENNYDYSDDVLISMKILLDYITNLQEENKRYAEKLTCKVEENKLPKKIETINSDFYVSNRYGENYERLSKEEIALDLVTLKNWINYIIDYFKAKENK